MVIRNKGYYLLATAFCIAVVSMPAHAWRSYGGGSGSATTARGGSASWGGGSGSASGYRGGSASWSGGSGSASGYRGGSASWSGGSGSATGAYGGSAAWSHPQGYHPAPVPAYGYRPPPVYYGNAGYSSGQVAAAGVAGLAVGAMVGASAASKQAPPPTTVVVQQQPMYTSQLPVGTNLNNLPGGCVSVNVSSTQFYQCGMSWFRPYFGSNGAYYQVVPAPY